MEKERMQWVDIAKGIGIILVAFAHIRYSVLSTYIYWFHMPLFFVVSGFLYKGIHEERNLEKEIWKKSWNMFIPYTVFGVFIMFMLFTVFRVPFSWVYLINFIKGGQDLDGIFGPFWFIPVMCFTQILFLFVGSIKNSKIVFFLMVVSYGCSHMLLRDTACWWNADVTLYAISLYYVGVLLQKHKDAVFEIKNEIIIAILSIAFVLLQVFQIMNYTLDMKHKTYTHPVLDLLIPICLSILVLCIAHRMEGTFIGGLLEQTGRYTLPVMYLHMPIAYFFIEYLEWVNIHIVIILAIVLPVLISKYVFERYRATRILFLGKMM